MTLTERQMAMIEFIAQMKEAKKESFTLDEMIDHLKANGVEHHSRQSMIMSMKGLIVRLQKTGVKIEPKKVRGRSVRQSYLI